MHPSMEGILEELRRLTNEALLCTLKAAARKERHITLRVLLLLIEMDQRRLHLDQYSSLFAYCTDQLRYSSSAAGRRIAAARCLRDYPRVWPMLLDGRLNLTTLCIIARVISNENADELLDRAAGGTQRQVEELAAQFGGPRPVRDRIKPVRTLRRPVQHATPSGSVSGVEGAGTPETDMRTAFGSNSTQASEENVEAVAGTPAFPAREPSDSPRGAASESATGKSSGDHRGAPDLVSSGSWASRSNSGSSDSASSSGTSVSSDGASSSDTSGSSDSLKNSDTSGSPGTSGSSHSSGKETNEPLTYDITFRADAAFVEKLRRAQALLSAGDPNPALVSVFDRGLELVLDRHDPERREARRRVRRARREARGSARVPRGSEKLRRSASRSEENADTPTQGLCDEAVNSRDQGVSEKAANNPAQAVSRKKAVNSPDQRVSDEASKRPARRMTPPEEGGVPTGAPVSVSPRPVARGRRRKLPQWVRDFVFLRDGKRCSYAGPEGRCPAVQRLEIEHEVPIAKGGTNDLENLRAFCRAHNQRAAEIAFGAEFMRQRRERNIVGRRKHTPAPGVNRTVNEHSRAGSESEGERALPRRE